MDIKEPIVLLVGNDMSRAYRLVDWLQSLGCEYHFHVCTFPLERT